MIGRRGILDTNPVARGLGLNERPATASQPWPARPPVRALFLVTSLPVGGAETLLLNLTRQLDRRLITPRVACLKEPGPLAAEFGDDFAFSDLLTRKWDFRVLPRLVYRLRRERIDVLVTVGAGDKMFWGRLGAKLAGLKGVACSLHSTGWPDGVGLLNRWLTPMTHRFIAVAAEHGRFLVEEVGFPASKVTVIPNGVDAARFTRNADAAARLKQELGLNPTASVVTFVAALRPEKNHELFLEVARRVNERRTAAGQAAAHFLIVGDGPCREALEGLAVGGRGTGGGERGTGVGGRGAGSSTCSPLPLGEGLGVRGTCTGAPSIHFLGCRSDIPAILSASDVFLLTSHNEANPVSILEALSCEVPVVATRVGSVAETVVDNETGFLAAPGDAAGLTQRVIALLDHPLLCRRLGEEGRRRVIARWSMAAMARGYEGLLLQLARRPANARRRRSGDG